MNQSPKITKITSEAAMLDFGKELAKKLQITPVCLELIGDVGAGKTTLTRGLGAALGITSAITSPSFTISKTYPFRAQDGTEKFLVHYDFYRLGDPGLMQDDLNESLADPNAITVVEWADSVNDALPADRLIVKIRYTADGGREIETSW